MSLSKKIDFAVVFTVTRANPNGDPLNDNRPRIDYDGYGEVSDVCLKRKLRNRLQDMGKAIFVQSDERRDDGFRSLKDRFDANTAIKAAKGDRQKQAEEACRTWFDVRAFGQVFAFKDTKGKKRSDAEGDAAEGENAVSIGVRGPVTIQTAVSIEPVNVTSMRITKSVNLETNKKDSDVKSSDTMGMKHRVDFGVYTTFGSINCQLAEKTGFSGEDAAMLLEALKTMFDNDVSAARPDGSMEIIKIVWWKHNCKNGQYSSAQVHRSLHVTPCKPNESPEIHIDPIEGLSFDEFPSKA